MARRPRPGTLLPVGAGRNCPTTCPTRQTLARLADRWTIVLVEALAGGPRRFGQLRAVADGISEKMLTQTLRSLERDGLVARDELPGSPPGVAYRLTDLGNSLMEPLAAIRDWGQRHMPEVEAARTVFDGR